MTTLSSMTIKSQANMITIVPKPNIDAAGIKIVRDLTGKSIFDIKVAAAQGRSVREFCIFGDDWEHERLALALISELYSANDDVPFLIFDHEADPPTVISAPELKTQLKRWREIELETQKNTDLEMGYIEHPSQFKAHDDNWFE